MKRYAILLLAAVSALCAQNVRVIRFGDSKPFRMGKVTSRRIVHPDLGAKRTTLNFSISGDGDEFAQHVHDYSDDTILVLQGQMYLRQGDSRVPYEAGECAFVPTGQIHGTVTRGTGETVMISFQTPPDMVLYTGARDSSKPGAAPPKGVITPGAVKKVNFAQKDGFFTGPWMGAKKGAGAHRVLARGQKLSVDVEAGAEQVFFVWTGGISSGSQKAGERDAVLVQGPAHVTISGDAERSEVIQIVAPPVGVNG